MSRKAGFKQTPETIAKITASRRARAIPPLVRLHSHVDWDYHGVGCHQWKASFRSKAPGYPTIWFEGKQRYAHIVACILAGKVCPPELVHDHICHNNGCVNPDHIRFVTERQNSLENNSSPHAQNARKTECAHGHPLTGGNLAVTPSCRGLGATRVCLTCYPRSWRFAVEKREPYGNPIKHREWVGPFRPDDEQEAA